ncbi:NAD(P)/FAD-dependent oxidoreductase [Mechercharimyces sp. CAU 1602]|uniref:NAD(P)/FAD-dependent oxidoreductase n=1 Tax=Mechercharimyces sp. CAU 1602 TaxID=2973933 RepID=UPI002161AD36|nr:NAD(P)/FAD-dependent oxidoreductase [Mechercharimyces sp. CAU 1602]MCS1351644.1 NAD(P)/FAD-dependent oxidoreductase [Mechercharimyces sp. CAU 1602]
MSKQVIVVGGGPAGLMAAAAASTHGASVLLIEKGEKLGRKLAISGGGRCNVTNRKPIDELIRYIPGNGRFLYSAFANFNNEDIISFFEELGVALKEEDEGRMFPVTDKAQSVVDALVGKLRREGVRFRLQSPVARLLLEQEQVVGVELENGEKCLAAAVIVAVGGKSVPKTGSTGEGYGWAESVGHTITELYPTEVPLTSDELFIKEKRLQGLSLRGVELAVLNHKGKKLVTHRGDMIFTHFGISGPIALRCSQFVVKEQKKRPSPVRITLDWVPDISLTTLQQEWESRLHKESKRAIRNVLKPLLPERGLLYLLERADVDPDVTYANLSKKKWLSFCQLVKAFPLDISGTLPLERAFITGGGVHLKEINPSTLESKQMEGLYFCGEILDIHGYTGGYNITAAFATGFSAGKHAAESGMV